MDSESESGFDPYLRWLGIRDHQRPPNHYRLLGLDLFEDDADVISMAADRQMAHVHTFQAGVHAVESQKLLNELALARICLLCPEEKSNYDRQLKSGSVPAASTRDSADLELAPLDEADAAGSPAPADSTSPKMARPVEKSPFLTPVKRTPGPAAAGPRPVASLIDEDELLLAATDTSLTDPSATHPESSLMLGPRHRKRPWAEPVVWVAGAAAGLVLLILLLVAVTMHQKRPAEVARGNEDVSAVDRAAPPPLLPPPAAAAGDTVQPLDTGKLPGADESDPMGDEPTGGPPTAVEPSDPLPDAGEPARGPDDPRLAGEELPPELPAAPIPTEPDETPLDPPLERVDDPRTPAGPPDASSRPESTDTATPVDTSDSSAAWDPWDPWSAPPATDPQKSPGSANTHLGAAPPSSEAAATFRSGQALRQSIAGRWRVQWQAVGGASRVTGPGVEYLDFATHDARYGRSDSPAGPVTPLGTWEVRGSEVVAEHASNYIDRFRMVAPNQISAVRLGGGEPQMRGTGYRSADSP